MKRMAAYLHKHYHWVVAGVMFLMVFIYGGAGNNLVSLHIAPVSEYLEISRAEFTMAGSVRTIVSMISTFLSGFLISRYGVRLCAGMGMVLCAGGYIVLALVENTFMLSFGNGLLGVASGLSSTTAAVYIARVWFHRHSGTILGLITAASGIGAGVMCMIQTAAIETSGFRASYWTCACSLALGAVLVLALVRNKPHDIGLLPLGDGEKVSGRRPTNQKVGFAGLPMKELWKIPAFYVMMLSIALSAISVYMAFTVIRPFVVDCGYTAAEASAIQSMMMLLLTVVKIMTGYLNDHLNGRTVFALCLVLGIAGLVLLGITTNYILILIAVVLYTGCLPLTTLAAPLLATDLFGYRAQPQYTGILLSMIAVTSFMGEFLTNKFYDLHGSYHFSFFVGAALGVATLLLLLVAVRMKRGPQE